MRRQSLIGGLGLVLSCAAVVLAAVVLLATIDAVATVLSGDAAIHSDSGLVLAVIPSLAAAFSAIKSFRAARAYRKRGVGGGALVRWLSIAIVLIILSSALLGVIAVVGAGI